MQPRLLLDARSGQAQHCLHRSYYVLPRKHRSCCTFEICAFQPQELFQVSKFSLDGCALVIFSSSACSLSVFLILVSCSCTGGMDALGEAVARVSAETLSEFRSNVSCHSRRMPTHPPSFLDGDVVGHVDASVTNDRSNSGLKAHCSLECDSGALKNMSSTQSQFDRRRAHINMKFYNITILMNATPFARL